MDFFFLHINFKNKVTLESFNNVVTRCKVKQNLQRIVTDRYIFAVNKISNFCLFDEDERQASFMIGRDFKNKKIAQSSAHLEHLEMSFPYLKIKIDKVNQSCTIENDSLGLFTYFYCLNDHGLFVTNHIETALEYASEGRGLTIDPSSYYSLFSVGHTLPGQTLYKEVQSSYPLHNLVFNEAGLKTVKKNFKIPEESERNPQAVYHAFSHSVKTILTTSDIKWINLTGGMDTRLILSTLSPWERQQYEFLFDGLTSNPSHMPYDRPVIDALRDKFHLKVRYTAPYTDVPNANEYLTEYSFYNHLLTGMYGGESLGAGALLCMPQEYYLESKDEAYLHFLERKNHIIQEMSDYVGSDHHLYFSLYCFINSSMSRIYNDKVWLYPTQLSQKKISPFINTTLLSLIFSSALKDINQYTLYHKVYEHNVKEMFEIPFHSTSTGFDLPFIKKAQETSHETIVEEGATATSYKRVSIQNLDQITAINNQLSSDYASEIQFVRDNFIS